MPKLKPGKKPEPQPPWHDTPKTGRDDGTKGQEGTGYEQEVSRNPLSKEKKKEK